MEIEKAPLLKRFRWKKFLAGLFVFAVGHGLHGWASQQQSILDLARSAQEASLESKVQPVLKQGQMYFKTGFVSSKDTLKDILYLKQSFNSIELRRIDEMYSWQESRQTSGVGASQKTIFIYKKDWTASPADSSSFKEKAGHENPRLTLEPKWWRAQQVFVANLPVSLEGLTLPPAKPYRVKAPELRKENCPGCEVRDGVIYLPHRGKLSAEPQVGDRRIRFLLLDSLPEATVLGHFDGSRFRAFPYGSGKQFYHLVLGNRSSALDFVAAIDEGSGEAIGFVTFKIIAFTLMALASLLMLTGIRSAILFKKSSWLFLTLALLVASAAVYLIVHARELGLLKDAQSWVPTPLALVVVSLLLLVSVLLLQKVFGKKGAVSFSDRDHFPPPKKISPEPSSSSPHAARLPAPAPSKTGFIYVMDKTISLVKNRFKKVSPEVAPQSPPAAMPVPPATAKLASVERDPSPFVKPTGLSGISQTQMPPPVRLNPPIHPSAPRMPGHLPPAPVHQAFPTRAPGQAAAMARPVIKRSSRPVPPLHHAGPASVSVAQLQPSPPPQPIQKEESSGISLNVEIPAQGMELPLQAPKPSDQWYVLSGSNKYGPFGEEELKAFFTEGRVLPETPCRRPGSNEIKRLDQILKIRLVG